MAALLALLSFPVSLFAADATIVVNCGAHKTAEAAAGGEAEVNWNDADSGDDTACTECFAATELQRCLRKMTSSPAGFSIVDDEASPPAGDVILVGGPGSNALGRKWQEQLHVADKDLAALGRDGYRIKSARIGGRQVHLVAGGSRVGTLYGAYDLLYRLGCRWFAPEELHEHLPHIESLGQWDVKEQPSSLNRGYYVWEDRGTPEFFLWMARNRMNYWCIEQSNHALLHKLGIRLVGGFHDDEVKFLSPYKPYPYKHPQWSGGENLPADPYPVSPQYAGDANKDGKLSYFEAHPEWYYFDGRKRVAGIRLPEFGCNFCTSNGDAPAEFVKNYVQALIDGLYQDADIVRFMTLDGGKWCKCEGCQALGSPTDRYLRLAHQLMTEIKKARAAGRIHRPLDMVFMIYRDVLAPPSRPLDAQFEQATVGMFFPIERCYVHQFDDPQCPANSHYWQSLKGWGDSKSFYPGQLAIGEYYNVSKCQCLPVCYMHGMANDIPLYHRLGARNFDYMHVTTAAWGSKALTNYQFARQIWDVKTDCSALWTDYFQHRYGPAAETMRKFYDSLEKMLCNVTELKYGLGPRLDRGAANLFPNPHLQYERKLGVQCDGPTLLEMIGCSRECRKLIDQARRMEVDPRVEQRLAEDDRCFTYAERTLDYYLACVDAYRLARAGKREEAKKPYEEARRLAELLHKDTESTGHGGKHAGDVDALTATRAQKALGRIAKLLAAQ
jgi:hypothetical protein